MKNVTKILKLFLPLLCCICFSFTSNQEDSLDSKSSNQSKSGDQPIVILETTQGPIEIALMPDIAPKAVKNFLQHAKEGYYDGLTFHRVIKGFMIQGGDPKGNGTGGESIYGKPFEDEFSPKATFSDVGILAMANRGPTTNGSQFFITTVKTPWLNNKHTIFGKVIGGYDVVKKIESVPTGPQDKPLQDQKIIKIVIKKDLSE